MSEGQRKPTYTVYAGSCCCGIPVYLHYYLFAVVVFQVFYALFSIGFTNAGMLYALWSFLLYGPILFGTVLMHELGHCAAAYIVGGHAEQILLWPLGGLAYVSHSNEPCSDLKVAIAGPLTHIPMALFWLALEASTGPLSMTLTLNIDDLERSSESFMHTLSRSAVMLQIQLFAFNLLLPAYPLDGGRVFADLLRLCKVPTQRAAKIVAGTAMVIAAGLVGVGIWMMAEVALWVGANSFELWCMENAAYHPLFGGDDMQEL